MAKARRRVLLKLSGEALVQSGEFGLNGAVLKQLASQIVEAHQKHAEIAVVVGGGNIWRYSDNAVLPIERTTSDYMGMLATVMNAIALQNALEDAGLECRVQSGIQMPQIAEAYVRRRAIRHLEKGRVVLFAAGSGQPYFTTDTAAALRALEIGADVLLKDSKVEGVYDKDPAKHADAKLYKKVSYTDVLSKDLRVMDATAISLCRENKLPIVVFNVFNEGGLAAAVSGKPVGTTVTP